MAVSMLKLNKKIEKGNEKFAKMTKQQKAVAVAKDVLKYLRYTNVNNNQRYCSGDFSLPKTACATNSVQPFVDKLAKNCDVCALGGMFLSYVRLFNKVNFDSIGYVDSDFGQARADICVSRNFIISKFQNIFSPQDLNDIEEAFESKWIDKYKNSKECMRAIMKNVIKNKGRFVRDWELVDYEF